MSIYKVSPKGLKELQSGSLPPEEHALLKDLKSRGQAEVSDFDRSDGVLLVSMRRRGLVNKVQEVPYADQRR